MKRFIHLFLSALMLLVFFTGCKDVDPMNDSQDTTVDTTTPTTTVAEPVLTVNEDTWVKTFSDEGLQVNFKNYTVTNYHSNGYWDTCVTPERASRISKNNSDEVVAGIILTNGDDCVLQYSYNKENGWEQGTYDETDKVELFISEITQDLTDPLSFLSGEFENAVWNEDQSCYVAEVIIPYDGPAMEDPTQETPEVLSFEVFFSDGNLTKINMINGESLTVIHSFGSTPVPELPDA